MIYTSSSSRFIAAYAFLITVFILNLLYSECDMHPLPSCGARLSGFFNALFWLLMPALYFTVSFILSFQLFGCYWQVGDDVKIIDATGKFVMPG